MLYGELFRKRVNSKKVIPMIGVYDVYSSILASKYYSSIFCSGYGFSASYYGLPDEGYIAWSDMIGYIHRIRSILPNIDIIVDVDEGYGDPNILKNTIKQLYNVGASGFILEDQRRPKKCGHLPGKELIPLSEYILRLEAALSVKKDMYVIARTDSNEIEDILKRVECFSKYDIDAILVEGVSDLSIFSKIKDAAGNKKLVINLIEGGETNFENFEYFYDKNISIVNYSTPCLFSAHAAIDKTLSKMKQNISKKPESGITLIESSLVIKNAINNSFK